MTRQDTFQKMQHQVAAVLRECPAVWETGRLVVGVSGGPDSLSLLHLLRFTLQPEFAREGRPLQLIPAHLNHQFRPEAAAEAAYVQRICREWGLDCHLDSVDVPALVAEQGGSLEETARQVRYQFLAEVAQKDGARAIAVAHHADDQAETVLMHFLRGAGPAGLSGMRPVSPLPEAPQLTLVRPFLSVSRADIEAYCADQGLEPLMDRSNLDTTFFRNRLRHELMPILESYNPQIRRRLQLSAEVWAADAELLAELRDAAWKQIHLSSGPGWSRFDLAGWQTLPLSLRRSILRQAVWKLQASLRDVGFAPIEQAREILEKGQVGDLATLPGALVLTVEYSTWTMALPGRPVPYPVAAPQLLAIASLPVSGQVALVPPWQISATWVDQVTLPAATTPESLWQAVINPAYRDSLHIRSRQPGERFQPLGLGGHSVKIKALMINRKIPAGLRDRWPIVATTEHPVWIPGLHLDHRARLLEDGPAIHLRCQKS